MDKSQTPRPRPGECRSDLGANDTLQLSESSMNFIKRHSLMDWAVQASRRVGGARAVRCIPQKLDRMIIIYTALVMVVFPT